jgi:hypothetical protein
MEDLGDALKESKADIEKQRYVLDGAAEASEVDLQSVVRLMSLARFSSHEALRVLEYLEDLLRSEKATATI